ncbi:hypothetical protein ON010_g16232 [Phytophthora cinnamomi]|nr:hypothetical protein ON010_g16232 [Phytophthora cinnamomi]
MLTPTVHNGSNWQNLVNSTVTGAVLRRDRNGRDVELAVRPLLPGQQVGPGSGGSLGNTSNRTHNITRVHQEAPASLPYGMVFETTDDDSQGQTAIGPRGSAVSPTNGSGKRTSSADSLSVTRTPMPILLMAEAARRIRGGYERALQGWKGGSQYNPENREKQFADRKVEKPQHKEVPLKSNGVPKTGYFHCSGAHYLNDCLTATNEDRDRLTSKHNKKPGKKATTAGSVRIANPVEGLIIPGDTNEFLLGDEVLTMLGINVQKQLELLVANAIQNEHDDEFYDINESQIGTSVERRFPEGTGADAAEDTDSFRHLEVAFGRRPTGTSAADENLSQTCVQPY